MSSAPKNWRQKLSPPAPPSRGGSCGSSVRGCCLAPQRIESRFSGRGQTEGSVICGRGRDSAGRPTTDSIQKQVSLFGHPGIKQVRFSTVKSRATFRRVPHRRSATTLNTTLGRREAERDRNEKGGWCKPPFRN